MARLLLLAALAALLPHGSTGLARFKLGLPAPKATASLLPPTYFINRDEDEDRRASTERQLAAVTSLVTRVRATNATEVEACLAGGMCVFSAEATVWNGQVDNMMQWQRFEKHIYSKVEVAVSLSHVRAVAAAFADGVEIALILEDDADLRYVKSTEVFLDAVAARAPADWQVLQLFSNNPAFYANNSALDNCGPQPPEFVPWSDLHWSTMAYLVNRDGMRAILTAVEVDLPTSHLSDGAALGLVKQHVFLPTPVVADHMIYRVARSYSLTRPLFRHGDAYDTVVQLNKTANSSVLLETDIAVNAIVDDYYKRTVSGCAE